MAARAAGEIIKCYLARVYRDETMKPPRQVPFSDGGVAGSPIVFLPKVAAATWCIFSINLQIGLLDVPAC
jgi:hypothetical protein